MMVIGIFIGFTLFCMLWMAWLGPAISEVVLTKHGPDAVQRFCIWETRAITVIVAAIIVVTGYIILDGFVCSLSYEKLAMCEYIMH